MFVRTWLPRSESIRPSTHMYELSPEFVQFHHVLESDMHVFFCRILSQTTRPSIIDAHGSSTMCCIHGLHLFIAYSNENYSHVMELVRMSQSTTRKCNELAVQPLHLPAMIRKKTFFHSTPAINRGTRATSAAVRVGNRVAKSLQIHGSFDRLVTTKH